jgi:hypothetical protein
MMIGSFAVSFRAEDISSDWIHCSTTFQLDYHEGHVVVFWDVWQIRKIHPATLLGFSLRTVG